MKTPAHSRRVVQARPLEKAVASIWAMYGMILFISTVRSGFPPFKEYIFPWIEVVVELVLVASSLAMLFGKRRAWATLLLSLLFITVWAGDIMLFGIYKLRFDARFWLMFGTVGLCAGTLIIRIRSSRNERVK